LPGWVWAHHTRPKKAINIDPKYIRYASAVTAARSSTLPTSVVKYVAYFARDGSMFTYFEIPRRHTRPKAVAWARSPPTAAG
jgi:hypothetical protein